MALEIAAAAATIRSLAAVVKEAGKIELHQKVLELHQILLEAVIQNTELAEKNHALSERIRVLEGELAQGKATGSLDFDGQVYWRGERGKAANGPLCPACRDKDDRDARMTDRGNGFSCCTVCNHCVNNSDLRYPELRLSREEDFGSSDPDGTW